MILSLGFLLMGGMIFSQELVSDPDFPPVTQEVQPVVADVIDITEYEDADDFDDNDDADDAQDNSSEEITYTTSAWSLDSAIFAQIDKSNIIIKDGDTLEDQYTIETPYENILSIQFANPGFYSSSDKIYYITFITDSNIVEMRQLSSYEDEFGNATFYDEIIFSMQGSSLPEPSTDEQVAEASDDASEEMTDEESAEETEEEQEEEKFEYQALALIRYKNTDSISFKLKISYIPKPYILGISLSAGFTEYKLIQPFYFGGVLEPHVGIPQKAFPYKYTLGGTNINGPLIVGGKLYTPFGICVFPFQENIEFFVELAPGLSLNMMWDAKFGKNSITSKMYPAFYGMLRTGASYKGFSFFIEGNFDAILGFGVSAGIGYSLNFDLSSTPDYAPSLEDK